MKKLITIDVFIAGIIAALGYGLSYDIPRVLGCKEWQNLLICLSVGYMFDSLANKIVFSRVVQSNALLKVLVFVAFLSIFLAVQYSAAYFAELSMHEYILEQYAYVILASILGFAFSRIVRWYRARKFVSVTAMAAMDFYMTIC